MSREHVRLSYDIVGDAPCWPDTPKYNYEQVSSTDEGDDANFGILHVGNHFGTHVDAPYHCAAAFCRRGGLEPVYGHRRALPEAVRGRGRPTAVTTDTTDHEDDRADDEASHVEVNPMRMGDAALRAMSIKISWLRSFLAVAERGGFGAAAQAVHLSQSRVSAHIAALESALGFTLFKRTSRPIALTRAGGIFRGHAERALEELQEGIVSVRVAHGMRQRRIVVASYPSVSSVFLPSVLSILRRDHPDITVELVESTSAAALEDALRSGVADVAFRPLQPALHGEGFRATSLWRESIVAVMRSDDPLAQLTAIGIGDLEGRALIGNPSGTEEEGGGFDLRHAIGDAASSMTIAYLSDQPATMVALVRAAFGIGVISQLALVTVSLEGLAARPIESPTAFRDVGIFWSEGRESEAAVQAFLECVGKATVPHGVLATASADFERA